MIQKINVILLLILCSASIFHCYRYSENVGIVENNILSESNIVYTSLGRILGSTNFKTRLGKIIYAFRGIRFAEPPIGNRRFQPPEPRRSWGDDILNATEEGPACPQTVRITSEFPYRISEDCLRLNIYTTKMPGGLDNSLRPVMVFFHSGEFYGMSGISYFLGPEYLLDADNILVTVNYRLGALGFISTGDEHAPGNLGLKDQVFALRWIQNHIQDFGGDPNQVTIMGSSVALHLVSPMSKGLFHRGIVMSGLPKATLETPKHQYHLAEKQAELLDCPSSNSLEILECLKTKDAEDISTTLSSFQELGLDPILIWKPVVEPAHSGEKFLTDDPNKLFKEGKFTKVPILCGITDNEFAYLAYEVVNNKTVLNEWNNNFAYAAPIGIGYERNTSRSKNISDSLRSFYFSDSEINESTVEQLGKMYADGMAGFVMNRFANLISQWNPFPIYFYKFAYKGLNSYFYLPKLNRPIGPVHYDDLIYIFFIRHQKFPLFGPNDPAIRTVERMTKLYTNFAKFGNPTPEKDPITDRVIWEPFTSDNKKYMNIQCTLKMKQDMFAERYAIWNRLFPI
ncbi:esterase E4-like [Chrysoperla carnea]|uniref:esterase E4-like n=1 Tax=Chrysoperla carnea TaxID=189513 RepID=UPI001D067543|nr:esterase E4-like [Chrysoperla carnea]